MWRRLAIRTSEELVEELLIFVQNHGRFPQNNEPDFESLILELKKKFGSMEEALMFAGLSNESPEIIDQPKTKTKKKV